jgi:hypothetical protein
MCICTMRDREIPGASLGSSDPVRTVRNIDISPRVRHGREGGPWTTECGSQLAVSESLRTGIITAPSHTHTLTQKVLLYMDANTSPSSLCLGFQESWQHVRGDKHNNRSCHPNHAITDVRIFKTGFERGSAKIPGDSISLGDA